MAILPSAPISLLRKKIARKAGVGGASGSLVRLWTARQLGESENGRWDRVAEVDDGQAVGWWLVDGDVVIAGGQVREGS
jgi:hypothetical protein